jgi:hypothetical protein
VSNNNSNIICVRVDYYGKEKRLPMQKKKEDAARPLSGNNQHSKCYSGLLDIHRLLSQVKDLSLN